MAHLKESKGESTFATIVVKMGTTCTIAPIHKGIILGMAKVDEKQVK